MNTKLAITTGTKKLRWMAAGFVFAILWASAATATKMGLVMAQPLVIAVVRFGVAAAIMLFIAHIISGQRLPRGKEWLQLSIYGLLNISLYLGFYVMAMQTVTAGIGALAVATNPVFISFFSVFFLRQKLSLPVLLALVICTMGVICAAWPLLGEAVVTTQGLVILFISMLSYSIGAIYFSSRGWNQLSLFVINGWQTFIGGFLLLPVALFTYRAPDNHFNGTFWGAVLWLAIPVSIVAVQLWLWLLKTNAVRAGLWLFLCPLFGFVFAAWLVHDRISSFTILGVMLVIAGLLVSRRQALKKEKNS
ncbi:MAG: DMT family transporter [Flavisolibacter sp.]